MGYTITFDDRSQMEDHGLTGMVSATRFGARPGRHYGDWHIASDAESCAAAKRRLKTRAVIEWTKWQQMAAKVNEQADALDAQRTGA